MVVTALLVWVLWLSVSLHGLSPGFLGRLLASVCLAGHAVLLLVADVGVLPFRPLVPLLCPEFLSCIEPVDHILASHPVLVLARSSRVYLLVGTRPRHCALSLA